MSYRSSDRDVRDATGSSRSRDRDYRKRRDSDERDDQGKYKSRHGYDGARNRSRSRSREKDPHRNRQRSSPTRGDVKSVGISPETRFRERSYSPPRHDELPAPPPPPRISKISIGFSKPQLSTAPAVAIKMNLGAAKSQPIQKKVNVASVFNNSDDDEPEEMPAEARMRMKNIGRETPTSAGPNSFGKTKQGFCDSKKIFEKNLKEAMDGINSKSVVLQIPPPGTYKL